VDTHRYNHDCFLEFLVVDEHACVSISFRDLLALVLGVHGVFLWFHDRQENYGAPSYDDGWKEAYVGFGVLAEFDEDLLGVAFVGHRGCVGFAG